MDFKNMFTFSARVAFRALTFCLSVSLVACSSEEEAAIQPNDPSGPITFTTNINSGAATRAANDEWTANDPVGIYMLDENGNLSKDYHRANSQYKIERNLGNTFWQLVSTETVLSDNLYYPADNSKVRFTAYYPYNNNISKSFVASGSTVPDAYIVDVTDQSDLTKIDLLYHKGTTDYRRSVNIDKVPPSMLFEHKLSKVIIKILLSKDLIKADKTPSIGVPTIAIEGIPTTADFSLNDGGFTNLAGVSDVDDVSKLSSAVTSTNLVPTDVYASCEMIIVPHEETDNFISRKINVSFADPDDATVTATLTYLIPDVKVFTSGKQTTYNFTIKRDVIIVEDVTITDWTNEVSDHTINESL